VVVIGLVNDKTPGTLHRVAVDAVAVCARPAGGEAISLDDGDTNSALLAFNVVVYLGFSRADKIWLAGGSGIHTPQGWIEAFGL
jgi:hypothetical protein